MTAEVAILNREAVAMAADSAATFSDGTSQKISSSANKIFSLSKHHPVGLMIYGNALFMGVPWEVIIKVYRRKLADTRFNTLYEYGQNFIEFLKGDLKLFPEKEQVKYATGCIYSFFHRIKSEITDAIKDEISKKGKIEESEIVNIAEVIISNDLEIWQKGICNIENPEVHREEIKVKYKDIIDKAEVEIFEKLPLPAQAKINLREIVSCLFTSFPDSLFNRGVSGIVISGFGEDEIFPSVVSFSIEGIANNVLKYKEDNCTSVDYDMTAIILPYAQQEMVATFIDGISPRFSRLYNQVLKETIENYPRVIIDKIAPSLKPNVKKDLIKEINKVSIANLEIGLQKILEIQRELYVDPILSVVTFLPKNELAEMAESLVNLTCLRKKISMDDETVGGPIDVAVISKGDGLIWIRRKHYFEPEMNQHFFVNYLKK